MSEYLDNSRDMGLPAAMLHALVPRSPSLAKAERPPAKPPETSTHDVDRFTSNEATAPRSPEPVVDELRRVAELHQAQQAARSPGETDS